MGIWHETFQVSSAESVYVHLPPIGLARATNVVPVARKGDSARERLSRGQTQAV